MLFNVKITISTDFKILKGFTLDELLVGSLYQCRRSGL